MAIALEEAVLAANGGDVPVGAIVVTRSGRIAARAGNRVERDCDPTAHAEILALREAAQKLGSTHLGAAILVTTLEPCVMCLGAIAHSRIGGLVHGAADPIAGAVHSACDWQDVPLGGRSFWHMGGIMARESRDLLRKFFAQCRTSQEDAPFC